MPKIVLVGAGSVEFTRELVSDICSYEELGDSEIALLDVSQERLETAAALARALASALESPVKVVSHLDRRAALDGADYVISMMRVGGHQAVSQDFEIPARYGIRQAMGDTLGIGAIFRALCTIPALQEVADDLAVVSPDAWLFNYSNPMAMLCWSVYAGTAHQRIVGLCMSPDNTAEELADLVGLSVDDITYWAAGLNHQCFLIKFERDGEDLYPKLDEVIEADPQLQRRVRVAAYRALGYFPSESSEHFSDQVPWFMPHSEMVERFRIQVNDYIRRSERNLGRFDEVRQLLASGKPIEPTGYSEYAPQIIHSIETSTKRVVYGNVRNVGLIDNLPQDCCVEVPCFVDGGGLHPIKVGSLPVQLAALNRTYVNVADLTVRAALQGSRDLVYAAAMLDPATAAVLSPESICSLCDELIDAHARYLPDGIAQPAAARR